MNLLSHRPLVSSFGCQKHELRPGRGVAGYRTPCPETERIFRAELSRRFPPDIQRTARRKLLALHAATELRHLSVPPGNRLEALKADRKGQHSIRVNAQWRICFHWHGGNACDVEIVDYH